jgi:L-threonylcarbamoyladenylate synthase
VGVAPSDADNLELAAKALKSGQVVAIPTDTVYGLAADPFRPGATERLFVLKRRPREVHVPVLVAGQEQALQLAGEVTEAARLLMQRFWPGPLTVVLCRGAGIGADLGTDEATVGVRHPDHDVVTQLCRLCGPLATTSANRHGQPPLTTAQAVADAFGDGVALVLDGGTCAGAPSTVVDCTAGEPRLVRKGGIAWADVMAAAGSAGDEASGRS